VEPTSSFLEDARKLDFEGASGEVEAHQPTILAVIPAGAG